MTQIANTVRERLAAGQLALGMALRQARTVDIGRVLAACGFDFAFIDMEHNTMGVNTATLVVTMLETPKAIDNADLIAAVPGVDVLLIGTNDLTLEMGIPGKYDDPGVMRAYETVVAACKRHGKYPGMGGIYDHPTMEKYVKVGARFILCGSDLSFVMAGGQARAEFLRALKVSEGPVS